MAKKVNQNQQGKNLDALNETGRRTGPADRRQHTSNELAVERRKTPRRRQIDPTTCEREYTEAEIEFMHALDAYKRTSGRMFPTCSEILEVLLKLGYRKVAAPIETPHFGAPLPVNTTPADVPLPPRVTPT